MSRITILMYVTRILYSLLYTKTKAQHIYINNILYIVHTTTYFHASASSSGCLNLVHTKVIMQMH